MFILSSNSTMEATSFNISAAAGVTISGTLRTSGRGPFLGPGVSPTLPYGGTYGGSGGRHMCSNLSAADMRFTNTPYQIGSVDVISDLRWTGSPNDATFGSGGSVSTLKTSAGTVVSTIGGRGGGRIVINTQGTLNVTGWGSVLAEGASSTQSGLGSGSGGSIVITTRSLVGFGVISVKGGDASVFNINSATLLSLGGAGGGGRLSITFTGGVQDDIPSTLRVINRGGSHTFSASEMILYGLSATNVTCLNGGHGTLFLRLLSSPRPKAPASTIKAIVRVSNQELMPTSAATLLSFIPSYLTGIEAMSQALLFLSQQIALSWSSASSYISLSDSNVILFSPNGKNTGVKISAYNIYMGGSTISTLGDQEIGGVNVSCATISLDDSSVIKLSADFTLNVMQRANLNGKLMQVPFASNPTPGVPDSPLYYRNFNILGSGNVSAQSLEITNLVVSVQDFSLLPNGMLAGNNEVGYCRRNVSRLAFNCNRHNVYNGTVQLNNTIVLTAWNSLHVNVNATIRGAVVVMCAEHVKLASGSLIATDGRGCPMNTGIGGTTTIAYDQSSNGGSGGGYMGAGGNGQGSQVSIIGAAYTQAATFKYSSGSGGSSNIHLSDMNSFAGSGGGIVIAKARKSLLLLGTVSSNGLRGQSSSGGGAGGTVVINTRSLQGAGGSILAQGGQGGDSLGRNGAGGGGGGGQIVIFSPSSSSSKYLNGQYSFSGTVDASPGDPGTACNLNGCESLSSAQGGQTGRIFWPLCPPGWGNVYSTGQMCVQCTIGQYSVKLSSTTLSGPECSVCTNKPNCPVGLPCYSSYYVVGETNSDCKYICAPGYQFRPYCVNAFDNIVSYLGGLKAFVLMFLGAITVFVFLPAFLIWYRKKYYDQDDDKEKDFLSHIFSSRDVSAADQTDDPSMIEMSAVSKNPISPDGADGSASIVAVDRKRKESVDAFPSSPADGDASAVGGDLLAVRRRRRDVGTLKSHNEERNFCKMTETDLSNHACRVYLLGTNHPFSYRGGAWIMQKCRPICLRPTLHRDEYEKLANKVNQLTRWTFFSWDVIFFLIAMIFVPHLSALVLAFYRRRRTERLVKFLIRYDYACFRSPKQRQSRNCIRLGISPDNTLAYFDFLFDEEEETDETFQPLIKPGQPKLPASFRFAGLGSYFSPYFIDTNDLLLQAMPQTDMASSFIDEAWISFIAELNKVLRTIQPEGLKFDLVQLLRFLKDPKTIEPLGGLVVELCTFVNKEVVYPSDIEGANAVEIDSKPMTKKISSGSLQDNAMAGGKGDQSRGESALKGQGPDRDRDSLSGDIELNTIDRMTMVDDANFNSHRRSRFDWLSQMGDILARGPLKDRDGLGDLPRGVEDWRDTDISVDVNASERGTIEAVGSGMSKDGHRSPSPLSPTSLPFASTLFSSPPASRDGGGSANSASITRFGMATTTSRHSPPSSNNSDSISRTTRQSSYDNSSRSKGSGVGGGGGGGGGGRNSSNHSVSSGRLSPVRTLSNISYAFSSAGSKASHMVKAVLWSSADAHSADSNNNNNNNHKFNIDDWTNDTTIPATFADMCEQVYRGEVLLGIRVTHPKVDNLTQRLRDQDFECDDFYDVGGLASLSGVSPWSGNAERASAGSAEGGIVLDEEEGDGTSKNGGGGREEERGSVGLGLGLGGRKRGASTATSEWDHDLDEEDADISHITNTTDALENAERIYGAHARDMAKFYEIMKASDANLNSSSSVLSGTAEGDSSREGSVAHTRSSSRDQSSSFAIDDDIGGGVSLRSIQRELLAEEAASRPVSPRNNSAALRNRTRRVLTHESSATPDLRNIYLERSVSKDIANININTNTNINTPLNKGRKGSPEDLQSLGYVDLKSTPLVTSTSRSFNEDSAVWRKSISKLTSRWKDHLAHCRSELSKLDLAPTADQWENTRWFLVAEDLMQTTVKSDVMMRYESQSQSRESLGARVTMSGYGHASRSTFYDTRMGSIIDRNGIKNNAIVGSSGTNKVHPSDMKNEYIGNDPYSSSSSVSPSSLTAASSSSSTPSLPSLLFNWPFYLSSSSIIMMGITRMIFRVIFGINVYPSGFRTVRRVIGVFLILLSFVNLGFCVFIAFNFISLSSSGASTCNSDSNNNNGNSCNNFDYTLIVYFFPLPLTTVIAPLVGMYAVLLGPSPRLCRIYGGWTRVSLITCLAIVAIYIKNVNQLNYQNDLVAYGVVALVSSTVSQCWLVDLYVAHVERIRLTRGWDGLHTSLQVSKDNKKEIQSF